MIINIRPSKIVFYKVFFEYIKDLNKNQSILDIAAAGLKHADFFNDLFYVAADIDEDKLRNRWNHHHRNRCAIVCDIRMLPFSKSSFDNVVSTHTLSHIESITDTLNSIRGLSQLVRQNGSLFFTIEPGNSIMEQQVEDILNEHFSQIKKVRYKGIITKYWENRMVEKYNSSNLRTGNKYKIMLLLSLLLSYMDFIGTGSKLLYICKV